MVLKDAQVRTLLPRIGTSGSRAFSLVLWACPRRRVFAARALSWTHSLEHVLAVAAGDQLDCRYGADAWQASELGVAAARGRGGADRAAAVTKRS